MIKPAALFTDGAVLCRNKEIRVFGQADEGTGVTVTLTDCRGAMLAEAVCTCRNGKFMALLRPQDAQTGCCLFFTSGGETVVADDVAIGDVFLAGGQSNMELELRNAEEGPEQIRIHNDPKLRFFNVPRMPLENGEARKALEETRWASVSPGKGEGNSAVAYFFARKMRERRPEVPVGIIGCYWGGTSVTCWMEEKTLRTMAEGARYLDEYAELIRGKTMEDWQREEEQFQTTLDRWNGEVERYQQAHPDAEWPEVEAACGPAPWFPPPGPGSPYRPGGLAVTMRAKVAPVSLTGMLYYQGEDDADRTDCYDTLMIALIRHWREKFRDPELPFLFVQLPMWIGWNQPDRRSWAKLRLAQAAARDAVRNTGMVCLLDQGEYGNIHPTDKRPVGERLAALACAMLYGHGEVSPRATGKYTENNVLAVCLSAPVATKDGRAPNLMEIAGEDGEYVPARAEIRGAELLLTADGIEHPVHARYAWTDWTDRVNLFGVNGLPLEPFAF